MVPQRSSLGFSKDPPHTYSDALLIVQNSSHGDLLRLRGFHIQWTLPAMSQKRRVLLCHPQFSPFSERATLLRWRVTDCDWLASSSVKPNMTRAAAAAVATSLFPLPTITRLNCWGCNLLLAGVACWGLKRMRVNCFSAPLMFSKMTHAFPVQPFFSFPALRGIEMSGEGNQFVAPLKP